MAPKRLIKVVLNALLLTGLVANCATVRAQPKLKLIELDRQFEQPVDMTKAQDGTDDIYITERLGKVYRYSRADEKTRLILDLTHIVESKTLGGLLGLDFHPKFPDSSYFYVNYTKDGDSEEFPLVSIISRFTMTENGRADLNSEYVIMRLKQPGVYHNLGDVAFGPDGYLYVPSGDGSLENDEYRAGQNPKVRLGKLLRIDVDRPGDLLNYSIPPDNPYVNSTDTLDEIWSMGLRNPQQLSFDRATNDLWIGDIGEFNYQEMNYQPAGNRGGQNYGWSCMEGSQPYAIPHPDCERAKFYDPPRFEYPRTSDNGVNGNFIVGGYVYRGPVRALNGYFFCGDFLSSNLYMFDTSDPEATLLNAKPDVTVSNISCFGESNDGSMFVASYNGSIYRIEAEEPTSIGSPHVTPEPLRCYPNPARDRITVAVPEQMHPNLVAKLTDLAGRTLLTTSLQRQPHHPRVVIDFPDYTVAGVYLLTLTDGHRQSVGRVVVQETSP